MFPGHLSVFLNLNGTTTRSILILAILSVMMIDEKEDVALDIKGYDVCPKFLSTDTRPSFQLTLQTHENQAPALIMNNLGLRFS